MPDIHSLLDECQSQCKTLVIEIQRYKNTSELQQTTTKSLNSLTEALHATLENIRPFAEPEIRQFTSKIPELCQFTSKIPELDQLTRMCESQCQMLEDEIQTLKETKKVHQTTGESLNSLAEVLQATLDNIRPFAEPEIRQFTNNIPELCQFASKIPELDQFASMCESQSQMLEDEIQTLKETKEVHQTTTESLNSFTEVLQATLENTRLFAEPEFLRFTNKIPELCQFTSKIPELDQFTSMCESQCQMLEDEIQTLKETKEVHQTTGASLNSLAEVLQATLKNIQPLAEPRFRRFVMIMLGGTALNASLLLAVLLVIIFKG